MKLIDMLNFSFLDDTSRNNYARALVTPLIRDNVEGFVPLVIISSDKRGSGKTAAALSLRYAYNESPECGCLPIKEQALQDTIDEGDNFAVFDNVKKIDDPCDIQFSKFSNFNGRKLDSAKVTPVKTMFIITSNGIEMSEDLKSRSVSVLMTKNDSVAKTDTDALRAEMQAMFTSWTPVQGDWLTVTNNFLGL